VAVVVTLLHKAQHLAQQAQVAVVLVAQQVDKELLELLTQVAAAAQVAMTQ
jgi:hypothetical protein